MAKIGRPISCHCMQVDTCKTCYNRIKRREWVARNKERERELNASASRARTQRLKDDPVAYAAYRARRNAQKRAAYTPLTKATEAPTLTVTDLGEDRLYTIEEWLETFGPIGSHGNYFHPLIA